MYGPTRRQVLATAVSAVLLERVAKATVVEGELPWQPNTPDPPKAVAPSGWTFFTSHEAATVEAIVDRLIPADPQTPGGKDCGCAVFIDRQLAGGYGRRAGDYLAGPFRDGTKQQGDQSPLGPAQLYQQALAALDRHCEVTFSGKSFAALDDNDKDAVLKSLEDGSAMLQGVDSQHFFELILKDTQQGFFADPIYGGNRDMAAWKMIGFPGARYDYSDWVERHNERYPLAPVGINSHPDWSR